MICFKVLCLIFIYLQPIFAQKQNSTQTSTEKQATTTIKAIVGTEQTTIKTQLKSNEKQKHLVCPPKVDSRPLFASRCKSTKECDKSLLCCNNRCLKGIPAPPPEPIHAPALFGLVDRVCSADRIPELFDITQCVSDLECRPRICCPEKLPGGEVRGYCRTAEPKLDRLPAARQFFEPLKLMMSYMQCTPPPPPFLDVFPKACQNPLDCFPNLCCQENGKRYCRPPKRSLLALIATVGQRLIPSNVARDFINRLAP